MVSGREKALMDIIRLYEEQLKPPEEPQDLIEVVFNNIELKHRVDNPPGVLTPAVMKGSPDNYVVGEHYWIAHKEIGLSHPWFVPV